MSNKQNLPDQKPSGARVWYEATLYMLQVSHWIWKPLWEKFLALWEAVLNLLIAIVRLIAVPFWPVIVGIAFLVSFERAERVWNHRNDKA